MVVEQIFFQALYTIEICNYTYMTNEDVNINRDKKGVI